MRHHRSPSGAALTSLGEDTIVAMATPPGEGGVAIVRLSGPLCEEILVNLMQRSGAWESHRLYHGRVLLGEAGISDEVLAVLMRAPRSYTREDVAEVHCHGGRLVPGLFVDACVRLGARLARPGEFTLRAFLNGRLDLTQAESVLGVIQASHRAALRVAADGLAGNLSRRVEGLRGELLDWLCRLEAEIDFGEEVPAMPAGESRARLRQARSSLEGLLRGAEEGRLRSEGILTVLAGAPNAGKSTLLNLLLGEERALVTPHPGTTRDRLEESAVLGGIPFRLVDTAGLRSSEEPVERLGMERTREVLGRADLVLVVMDGSIAPPELDLGAGAADLVVLNKRDLGVVVTAEHVAACWPGALVRECSLIDGTGLHGVRQGLLELGRRLAGEHTEGVHLVNRRQQEALLRCADSLATLESALADSLPSECLCVDLREAVTALGQVTGADVTEEVLDRIFSNFCLGK